MKYRNRLIIGMLSIACYAQAQTPEQQPQEVPEATAVTTARVEKKENEDPMRSKTISKTFALDNSDKIVLANQYGSITIKIWDRKEIKADIDIRAYSNNEEDVQKLLEGITIEAGKSGDQVVVKTKMDQQGNRGSGSIFGKKWRREVKVDYVVYMPASNSLTMSQNYGNITMGDLSGPLYAKVQYGNFTAQNLSNISNYISVQYGNSTIQNINKGVIKHQYGSGLNIVTAGTLDVDAQYVAVTLGTIKGNAVIKQQYGAGLTIGTVENLELDAQYTHVKLGNVKGNAKIDQQYNNLSIGTVGNLDLDAQYTGTEIGVLRGNGKFDMQYNKLSIAEVGTGCKALNIDGGYLSISLGFNADYNADLDVHTSYAGFSYGDKISAKQTGNTEDSNSKTYVGKIGKGGGAVVKIKSDYGSVSLK
ncbi:MAG: hypothetical protein V4594_06000 [Bacteroidota bacterium]